MSALRWAAVPVIAGVLTGNVAFAAADEPAPPPTPTPTPAAAPSAPDPTPEPTATPTPEPTTPGPPATGSVVYVTTVTTTTTTVNAPIIVVAAPITTTLNTTTTGTNSAGDPTAGSERGGTRERLVMNLTGCGRTDRRSPPVEPHNGVRYAHVRLARDAILVVRVNHRRVATLRLPSTARRRTLRLRLGRNGMLSIHRPSGRVLSVQGCMPA
jgi:hypothetical protein